MNLTKVSLIGYLASEPKSRSDGSRTDIVEITLVGERQWIEEESQTLLTTREPQRILAFGRLGQIMLKYLKAGDRLYVEGRLANGSTGFDTTPDVRSGDVVANQMIMLGGRSKVRQPGEIKE